MGEQGRGASLQPRQTNGESFSKPYLRMTFWALLALAMVGRMAVERPFVLLHQPTDDFPSKREFSNLPGLGGRIEQSNGRPAKGGGKGGSWK